MNGAFSFCQPSPDAGAGTVEGKCVQIDARRIGDQVHGRNTPAENEKIDIRSRHEAQRLFGKQMVHYTISRAFLGILVLYIFPFVEKRKEEKPVNKALHNPDSRSSSRLCIHLRLLYQTADSLVECADNAILHDVAIFVGSREKLAANWKDNIPQIFGQLFKIAEIRRKLCGNIFKPHLVAACSVGYFCVGHRIPFPVICMSSLVSPSSSLAVSSA